MWPKRPKQKARLGWGCADLPQQLHAALELFGVARRVQQLRKAGHGILQVGPGSSDGSGQQLLHEVRQLAPHEAAGARKGAAHVAQVRRTELHLLDVVGACQAAQDLVHQGLS